MTACVLGGHGRGQPRLLLSKALGLLDGIQQLLFQLLIALVWWEIQTVETVERGYSTVSMEGQGCWLRRSKVFA